MAATCEELGIDLAQLKRRQLLVKAKILTEDGEYHPDFFSEETINKSKHHDEQTKLPNGLSI